MRKLIIKILMLLVYLFSYAQPLVAFAQPLGDLDAESLAISLVIDTSGSMEDTDPQMLRQTVAEVFIDYLNAEDYLGIITFNNDVDFVSPIKLLGGEASRSEMKEKLSGNIKGMGSTDYNGALIEANKQLEEIDDANVTKMIIFLTDGEPSPGSVYLETNNMETYMDALWETVSTIKDSKVPIYAIGFTEDIDIEILNKIAYETNGYVRIYEDVTDLDENLVQLLESRETIVEEFIEGQATTTEVINLEPYIEPKFWFGNRGFRAGEETVISAAIMAGNMRVQTGGNLKIDSFELQIEFDDGTEESIPFYDDGQAEHSDIRAKDGFWSNKISFSKNGSAHGKLVMTGTLDEEPLNLVEEIGGFFVAEPGTIFVRQENIDSWTKAGDQLKLSLHLTNQSDFTERVLLQVDEEIGVLSQDSLDLEANESKQFDLYLNLINNLEEGSQDFTLSIEPEEGSTTIDQEKLEYNVDVVSKLEALLLEYGEFIPLLGILLSIPLLIVLIGLLLYALLVRPHTKIRGKLTFWQASKLEDRTDIDLTGFKKNKVIISYGGVGEADYILPSNRYSYELVIFTRLIEKKRKFLLGWKALLTRKAPTELVLETTQPGIVEKNGNILTQIILYPEAEFISGEYTIIYTIERASIFKKSDAGKNLLEGRV